MKGIFSDHVLNKSSTGLFTASFLCAKETPKGRRRNHRRIAGTVAGAEETNNSEEKTEREREKESFFLHGNGRIQFSDLLPDLRRRVCGLQLLLNRRPRRPRDPPQPRMDSSPIDLRGLHSRVFRRRGVRIWFGNQPPHLGHQPVHQLWRSEEEHGAVF